MSSRGVSSPPWIRRRSDPGGRPSMRALARDREEENMSSGMSRRGFLTCLTTVAGGLVAGELRAAAPPKETGLSSEGLLVGHPGFQPRTVMPLPHAELPGFLSRAQLAAHHADYVRDVERLKATEQALHEGNAERYAALRRTQVASANAVLLHEFYFGGLAPETVELPRYLVPHLSE